MRFPLRTSISLKISLLEELRNYEVAWREPEASLNGNGGIQERDWFSLTPKIISWKFLSSLLIKGLWI